MIYIQSKLPCHKPHHFDAACAMYGAKDIGEDYLLLTIEDVISGKFDSLIRRSLFVGSTDFMREVFKRIHLHDVRLPKNCNRPAIDLTLGEAYQIVENGTKLFIKPVEIKLFTGFVLDRSKYACLYGLPDDTQLIAYEPFKAQIESEWRCYIHNHKLIDSRNYSGDFTICPDYRYISNVIQENSKTFPCAYTIDIGVLPNENVVIEYNDFWAIGNYGMPNDLYVKLLRDRYFEIIRK